MIRTIIFYRTYRVSPHQHGKPQRNIRAEKIVSKEEIEASRFEIPTADLERDLTPEKAKRPIESALELQGLLVLKLEPADRFGMLGDAWEGEVFPVGQEGSS